VQPGNYIQQGCLSCPIGPNQGDDLPGLDMQGNTAQDLNLSKKSVDVFNLQNRSKKFATEIPENTEKIYS